MLPFRHLHKLMDRALRTTGVGGPHIASRRMSKKLAPMVGHFAPQSTKGQPEVNRKQDRPSHRSVITICQLMKSELGACKVKLNEAIVY